MLTASLTDFPKREQFMIIATDGTSHTIYAYNCDKVRTWLKAFEAALRDPFNVIILTKGTKIDFPEGEKYVVEKAMKVIDVNKVLGEHE